VALAFLACGGAIFVLSDTTIQATAYLFLFLLGAADGTTEVVYDTLFQARLPHRILGGAFALAGAIQRTGMIVGFLVAPALLRLGPEEALVIAGALCLVGALVAGAALVRRDVNASGSYLEAEPALIETGSG
jgi:hypothetical protein